MTPHQPRAGDAYRLSDPPLAVASLALLLALGLRMHLAEGTRGITERPLGQAVTLAA